MKMNYKNIIKLILISTAIMIAFLFINSTIFASNYDPNDPWYTDKGGTSADVNDKEVGTADGVFISRCYHSFFTGTRYTFIFFDGERYILDIKAGETIGGLKGYSTYDDDDNDFKYIDKVEIVAEEFASALDADGKKRASWRDKKW